MRVRECTAGRRRARSRWLAPVCAAALAATLADVAAAAEPTSPGKRAAAEALFDTGLKLMKQGDFTAGCPKLEESQEMDPAVGTLLYLAECYERMGRSASAWATFREAASMARATGQDGRAQTGLDRAARIEPSLSKLTIDVASENASIPDLQVVRAGDTVPRAVWGSALPVDPGEVTIEARAPGYRTWTGKVTVGGEGDQQSVSVPPLERDPVAAGAASASGAEASSPAAVERSAAGEKPGRTQRTLAYVAGGLGVVGLGVGSYYGVRAMTRNDEAKDLCPENDACTSPRGVTLTEQARDAAWVSNIAFAAGGAFAIGAVVLFVTAPREAPPPVRVSAGFDARGAGFDVRGEF